MAQADRERASYVQVMGVSRELTDLIRTVKFENSHILTRPELYRFGIDTRAMAETDWAFESAGRPYVHKMALAKRDDGASFRAMEWRLFCENKDRARLMFVREFDAGATGMSSVIMTMAGSEKPVTFGTFPARMGPFEAWTGTIASTSVKSMLSASRLQMGEGTLTPDGKTNQKILDIGTGGLEAAWTRLFASCAAAPANSRPATVPPSLTSAPARRSVYSRSRTSLPPLPPIMRRCWRSDWLCLSIGALYTPQAAGTAALIVPPEKRGSAIAYVFLGWSVAAAVGLPLITFAASRYGWQAVYGMIGVIGCFEFPVPGLAAARRIDGHAGRSQDLGGAGPQPDGRAAARDHDLADVRPVRRFHFHGAAAETADRCRPRRRSG